MINGGGEREREEGEGDKFLRAPPPRAVIQKVFTGVPEI